MLGDKTRKTLIERIRNRADQHIWQGAWTEFYDLYAPFLRRLAGRNGLTPDQADELVQDVLTKVSDAIVEFQFDEARGRFRGWLKTIALRKLIDYRRRQKRQPSPVAMTVEPVDDHNPLEADWDRQYVQHVVEHAMRQVSQSCEPNTWACFVEHTLHGRPGAEVARQLGLSPAAVYQNSARTMQRIRQKCQEYEERLSDAWQSMS